MKIEKVKKLNSVERWLYWIEERESIRKKRKSILPWTDDTILQRNRFCNVRRMDDKVSQWLLHNWYEPNFNHQNMLFACTLARIFNQPETLESIGFPTKIDVDKIQTKLLKRQADGKRNFNGAYIVSTNGLSGNKVEILCEKLLKPMSQRQLSQTSSLEALCDDLRQQWGISTFLAGQISADLRWAVEGSWYDRNVWAPKGPGSIRGVLRLFGENPKGSMTQEEFLGRLDWASDTIEANLPDIRKRIEAIDIQNTFCEFDKYERVLWGQGRAKQRYPGGAK